MPRGQKKVGIPKIVKKWQFDMLRSSEPKEDFLLPLKSHRSKHQVNRAVTSLSASSLGRSPKIFGRVTFSSPPREVTSRIARHLFLMVGRWCHVLLKMTPFSRHVRSFSGYILEFGLFFWPPAPNITSKPCLPMASNKKIPNGDLWGCSFSQMLNVWSIYLHLTLKLPKCREIGHTLSIWVCVFSKFP